METTRSLLFLDVSAMDKNISAGVLCTIDDCALNKKYGRMFGIGNRNQRVTASNGDIALVVNVIDDNYITVLLNNTLIRTHYTFYHQWTK